MGRRNPSYDIWSGIQQFVEQTPSSYAFKGVVMDSDGWKFKIPDDTKGIIAFCANQKSEKDLQALGIPVINLSGNPFECLFPRVCVDERKTGELAARHLVKAGYSSFAVATGWMGTRFNQHRQQGFIDYLQQHAPDAELISETNVSAENISFLGTLPKTCGIFHTMSKECMMLRQEAENLGLHIPDDVGIMSCDHGNMSDSWDPGIALSLVSLPWSEVGHEAARQMLLWLEEGVVPAEETPVSGHEVLPDASTRLARNFTPLARQAHLWLTTEYNPTWRVQDIAKHLNCSVSTLYKNYQSAYGTGLKEELKLRNHEYALHLLRETHQSISDIATVCGYTQPSTFIQAFKKHQGLTPSRYRRRFHPPRVGSAPPHNKPVPTLPLIHI